MIEVGTYTPSTDVLASAVQIPHNLGVVPDFVVVMADTFTATSDLSVSYIANSYCSKSNLIASNKNRTGFASYLLNRQAQTSTIMYFEDIDYTKFLKEAFFYVPYYSSTNLLKAGITYHYAIGKFDE